MTPTPAEAERRPRPGRGVWLAWAAVAAAVAIFFVRGPLRQVTGDSHDFTMLWAAARCLWVGADPYRHAELLDVALRAGMPRHAWINPVQYLSLYPPTTYLALAPLGALPWVAAKWAWAGLNVLAVAAIVVGLRRCVDAARHRRGAGAIGLPWVLTPVLLWAPAHACLLLGNLSVVCAAAAVWACGPSGRSHPRLTAVLLGVATAVKPQLIGPLALAWMLVWRDRRAAVWLVATGLLFSLVAVGYLFALAPDWIANLRANLDTFTAGGTADPTAENLNAFTMIDLAPLLHLFLGHRGWVQAVVWLVTLSAVAAAAYAWARRPDRRDPLPVLQFLSVIATVTLLPVYHRFYDATLLLVPVAAALSLVAGSGAISPGRPGRRLARAGLWLGLGVFLVPGSALLYVAFHRVGWLPQSWLEPPWTRALLLHHQTVALVGLTAVQGLLLWQRPGGRATTDTRTAG